MKNTPPDLLDKGQPRDLGPHRTSGSGVRDLESYGYDMVAGVTLQAVACLMNDSRYSILQIGIGLLGVVLMILGFHHFAV